MKNSSLLCLCFLLLLLAASPLAEACSSVSCGDGSYAANSTYEANLRRLATVLLAEASSASPSHNVYVDRAVGYWPNRLRGVTSCRSGDCAACIADAFKQVETECPLNKEPYFYSRNCSLSLGRVRIVGNNFFGGRRIQRQSMTSELIQACLASGLIFQAIGLAWIFFLLLQDWRGRKKGTAMISTPLVVGDH